MIETATAEKWIFDTGTTDAIMIALVGTRWYNEGGPQGVTYPYVLYSHYASNPDTLGMGANRVLARLEYIICGIDNSRSYTRLTPIANQIDELFNMKGSIVIPGYGMILYSRRFQPFKLAEDLDTVNYRRLGGRYQIDVVPT
jgi:hypothetical protein